MKFYDTLVPYKILDYTGIQYGVCRDFNHISRYKGLRQLVHNPDDEDRFVALEVPNAFSSNVSVHYYVVPMVYENRLDLIAFDQLGNANYAWMIAYINHLEDGYSVKEGQTLKIPDSITDLFSKGEILASINPNMLNLGEE